MTYTLTAQNAEGAFVTFKGRTMKEALDRFDTIYSRDGFRIYIEDDKGIIRRVVRGAFRKDDG